MGFLISTGRDGEHETLKLHQITTEFMKHATFNWTKWSSNSLELVQAIPEEDRLSDNLIRRGSNLPNVRLISKALGLKQNTRRDSLVFAIDADSVKTRSETLYAKREVASLAAKLLRQSLWAQCVGWDDDIHCTGSLGEVESVGS